MALCAGVRILMRSAGPAAVPCKSHTEGRCHATDAAAGAGFTPRHRRHRHPPPGAEPATRNPPAAQGRSRRRDRPNEPRDLWKAMGITKRTCSLFRRRLWKARPGPTRARAFSQRDGMFWVRDSLFSGCFGTALRRFLPPPRGSANSGSVSGSRERRRGDGGDRRRESRSSSCARTSAQERSAGRPRAAMQRHIAPPVRRCGGPVPLRRQEPGKEQQHTEQHRAALLG